MAEDESNLLALVFRTFLLLCLTHLSSAACEQDSLGLENSVLTPDSWLTSSSKFSANTPAKNGRLNYTAGSSWCASSSDNYPYLEIDLQILHIICAVSTQGNHQADQWVKTFTLQSSTDGITWTNYTEDNQVSIKIFSGNYDRKTIVKHILYLGIVARYVRFVAGVKHDEACMRAAIFGTPRHKITGNIALFKPTEQLGIYPNLYSSHAVDGGRRTDSQMCTHTTGGPNPWWRVDLGRVEDVAEVHILNRDSFESRLKDAEIRVGNSGDNGGASNHLCATNNFLGASKVGIFFCKPTASGRYVYVRIAGNSKVVTLCELEVYSSYLHNLAFNQSATQASVFAEGGASRAVDGNKNTDWNQGSCMHTEVQNDPWWRVDLGASLPIAEVVIVNRLCPSCINDMNAFEIRIGNNTSTNTSCGGTLSLAKGEIKSFYCDPPKVGRYVSVVVPGTSKVVNMCEVEVYSVRQVSNGVTACRMNSVGVSNSSIIYDQRFSASTSSSSNPASDGRLKGSSAWIPNSNNNNNDYLQIDLGSVYVVCAVATQGNPSADDWTKTYKIETSLDNVNWQWYQENNTVKIFTGNSHKQEIVKNDLYNPLAVKFIRFYPVTFNGNKALRVEVFGSKQGCLSSVGNEQGVPSPPFSVAASSQLDGSHSPNDSFLYGPSSWCSNPTASSPQYLQFDFGKVVTVSGIATQGDAVDNKWVTEYAVRYGYDEQSWLDYAGGQHLSGNSDKSSVVVCVFTSPFAAQFVRILPKIYHTAQCMRVDLFGCRDFQVAFLYVNVSNATLRAAHNASVRLNCTTKSSKQRCHALVNEWRKDGVKLPDESGSSLTISYINASDIIDKYHCVSLSSPSRDVQCTAVYQCSASLVAVAGLPEIKNQGNSTVTVILRKPGLVTGVSKSMVTARTAVVTWTNYSPGENEAPTTSITLRYQNSTSPYHLAIQPGSSSWKELINLKPFSKYNVTVMVSSVLGNGLWSNAVIFETLTATPEITIQVDNTTGVTSQSIYVEWKKPNVEKLNGPFAQYTIAYRESGGTEMLASVTNIDTTFHTVPNLKKWTLYFMKVRVENRDHAGPWSFDRNAMTQQDAPSKPTNLRFTISEPSKNTRPRVKVTWGAPSEENGIITKYTLTYNYNFGGVTNSAKVSTNSQTFEYAFDVLGGIEYTVSVYAETIKPGPKEEQVQLVPVYKPSTAPSKIASQSLNETTYRISWDPLTREKSNGEVLTYEVKDIRVYHAGSPSLSAPRYENTTNTMVTLQELVACSTYRVLVRSYTSAGAGPFSPSLEIVTNAPGPPSDVKVGTPSKRSVTLSWKKPVRYGDDVQMYTVIYEGTKSYYPGFKHTDSVQTVALSREITDLYPDTKYNFVVVATTYCGDGDNSTMVTIRTAIDAPPPPQNRGGPQQVEKAGSSVNLTIWPAVQDNGPISYYQILVHRVQHWTDIVTDWKNFGSNFYISAQIPASHVKTKMMFLLGDGENKGGYNNKELSSGQKYKVYSRALTQVTSKKRSTDVRFLIGQAQLLAQIEVEAGLQREVRASLRLEADYDKAFEDLNSTSSKKFVTFFKGEMDKLYKDMAVYDRTEVLKLRSGSVIVYFILYFKSALTPEKGLQILNTSISSTGYYGRYKASSLSFTPEGSPAASTPTSCVCSCPKNEIVMILLAIIAVLVLIIIVLIAVIVWQRRKLGDSKVRRPYEVPEDKSTGLYSNEIARTNVLPGNPTQQRGSPDERAYMPLKEITQSKRENTRPNVEYAPLDVRTRSWEVAREDVDVDKIIGKGAFGQVAKGTVRNLPNGSAPTRVAIKMLKANAPESDKRDLESELELMKTLKPHPHVIKLLGCVTESEPLLVLIEYVPFGDLLGYLRKSRGLNDTYYKDPDIKPNTNLTSEQLMKFAWQIADGMSYLSMRKIIHRDLAARNVLVGERETCKVTDFGMARDVQQENVYERKSKGRLPVKWTAFEALLYGQYTTKSDVWSYGVLLYEIFTIGGSPYPRMDGKKIANSLQEGYRMPKPMHVDNELYEIMMNCWEKEPQDRPSFTSLTKQLKRIEDQHKRLINMRIYDNELYATLDDLNA